MKIGIYGGTFNPVHYGHLRTAEEIFEMLCLDSMVFMPSGLTPFDKPDPIEPQHRYNMVDAAIKDNPHFRISDIEIRTSGRSYTVDTVSRLKEKYGGSEIYFVLGTDAFSDLPGWKQPGKLISMINMVVVSRPGYTFSGLAGSPFIKNVHLRILEELDAGFRHEFVFSLSGKRECHLCNVTKLNISASGIRERVASGENINYLLPESVKSYIISNNLYTKGR